MKLNISYPANGSQKIIEIDDERKLRPFMEKRMGTEVSNPSPFDIRIRNTTLGRENANMKSTREYGENRKLIGVIFEIGFRRLPR